MEPNLEPRKIELEQDILNYLNTTRKWSMFLAILGFIALGLFIIIGLGTGTFLSIFNSGEIGNGVPGTLLIALILLVGIIYFFPVYFLFQFSKHMANAVHSLDKQKIKKAFKNLKFYFVYIGVLLIIILVLYVIVLAAAGASMSFLKGL